jgi:GT2 family glycosyltransferase
MKISVIIPCYNAVDTIEEQLEALSTQKWSETWEVIVVDNRSTDGSMEIVKRYLGKLPGLRIIEAFERQGTPYAINVGGQAADGDAFLFCDADDIVGHGYLTAMGKALSKHDFVASRMDVERLNKHRSGYGNPQAEGVQNLWYPPYLPHAGGGTLGVKSSLFHKVGGYDELLPSLHDTDFCFKVQFTGTDLHFVPDAVMHVRYRDSVLGTYRQSFNYAEYNVVLFKKYHSYAPAQPYLWRQYFGEWKKLLKSLPLFVNKKKRYKLAWDLGRQIGRLKGCIKHQIPPV